MEKSVEALERLHEEIRREKLKEERETEEWIRIQRTGGGAET